jgi:MGT family glycosyltransferase
MAKILAYTSPATGHVFPAAAVLDQLRSRGHQVILRTLSSQVQVLRDHGFEAEPINPAIEAIPLQDWRARTQQGALKSSVSTFVERSGIDGADLTEAINEHEPDAVLVDVNSWGALAAAERWGGKWATFCPYPLAMSSVDTPPFGLGLPPAHGPLGRTRDRALRPIVYSMLNRAMLPGVNNVRSQFGLAPLKHLDDQFTRPPLLIYMTAEPFEYPRSDWPANLIAVGPCEWEPSADLPHGLDDRPLVVVTSSSEFQADDDLLTVSAIALAGMDVTVVLTAPAHGQLGDLPKNVVSLQFAPHGPLLDRAVCAITHAGMGATQKALARGVPVVAVPFGRDQFEVARRVEVAGAGVRLPRRRLNERSERAAVDQARAMTAGAQEVASGFARAGGARAAATAVETTLLGHTSGVDATRP